MFTAAEIRRLRANPARFTPLLNNCSRNLNHQPQAVRVFGPRAHYTSTGTAVANEYSRALNADADAAYRLGVCYLISGNARYASSAQRILDAWTQTLEQVMSQQGKNNINFAFPSMILAASWVRGANNWNSAPFGEFLRKTILPQSQSAKPNNHGLWGVLLESSAAAYLGDRALLAHARERWKQILEGEVMADGSMPREMERSDTSNWRGGPTKGSKGVAYTHYALLPASIAAKIFEGVGQAVWTTQGGMLLGKAFAQAAAWTLHPESFPYYASNGGKLVGVRNAAYFPLLLKFYPNPDAQAVLKDGNISMNGFLLLQLFGD